MQIEANASDSGAIEYHARFDCNNDGWYDLVSANRNGPDLRIWLGSATGYSAENYLTYPIPFRGSGNSDMADLNLDGYPDLIHSGYTRPYLCIYWGTPTGPSPTDTTKLPSDAAEAVYVADFDKDTYLDIAGASHHQQTYIYWGSGAGYSIANRTDLGPGGVHNIESADLDKNGFLDIIITQGASPHDVIIFYQDSARYFSQQSLDFAVTSSSHGLSISDLNNDGYIDIVATGWTNITHSSIYWGSASGYSDADKLTLHPGVSYGGSAIYDFNNDGWEEIIYFRGRPGTLKPIIYWNTETSPWFSDTDTQTIGIPVVGSGGTVADFNKDGNVDVFVNNFIANSYSYVFYGPGFTSYDSLPVNRDHHGIFREPRQISDYISKVFRPSTSPDTITTGGTITYTGYTPGTLPQDSSRIRIYARAGNTPVPDASWQPWALVCEIPETTGTIPYGDYEYFQYKAQLEWRNPAMLPHLEGVRLDFSLATGAEEEFHPEERFRVINSMRGEFIVYFARGTHCKLTLYDIVGRKITNIVSTTGEEQIKVNRSGVYFLIIETMNQKEVHKLIVIM